MNMAQKKELVIGIQMEVLEKYPDLKRLKHEEELQEKKKVVTENKQLLKG